MPRTRNDSPSPRRRQPPLLRFETRHQPLLSRRAFARRLARNFLAATALIGVSLFAGMAGYRYLEPMSWVDAFVNAAMILSGMGPVCDLTNPASKVFAGCYALYSGLALIVAAGLLLAPVLHRVMHRFHLEGERDE